jgi:ATP:ADP antiporter, AAA family
MRPITSLEDRHATRTGLDRALSVFTDVREGEGALAVLMLVNIFLLLVCYSVIKTVREPLILLGGGAELRSYSAAAQAVVLIAFVPLYSWLASRVDRTKLLVGVTLFFVACIELFAAAVTARVPYVGVAFFIWVGIFNISLVAQFWSFANDIYAREAADRLFPVIVIGMTAGAPLGSLVAGRLFGLGITPQTILHIAAALLVPSITFYLWMHRRDVRSTARREPMSMRGGFTLVVENKYLRLIALLVVLLNVVNTTGEYLVARMLTNHVGQLALADPSFNRQAFIGAFSGSYQFWVNVTAFFLQAFLTSRLLKYRGLGGVLLALPLIALGGYAIVAAGVGFSAMRWIKTAENATDYSVMNTARQLLWLPASREEKYKAKQAIDTFFVRAGDVLSAGVVYLGTHRLHLDIQQFAVANVALTAVWLGVALLILRPRIGASIAMLRPLAPAAAAAIALVLIAVPARAQDSREAHLAAQRAEKSQHLSEYKADPLEHRLSKVESTLSTFSRDGLYPFVGSVFQSGGVAFGPGYRGRYADSGTWDVHGAWSFRNFKAADASVNLPAFAGGRLHVAVAANRLDAPRLAFYGIGGGSDAADRQNFSYSSATFGVAATVQATRLLGVGGGAESMQIDTTSVRGALNPNYRRTRLFAEIDSRTSPGYTRHGGLYRVEWSDYRQTNGSSSFQRTDGEVQQFLPILRENWVIALRALTSITQTATGGDVPYFLLPDLGGSETLRGYPSWRFRDRNRLLLSGEYRWTAGPFADMALFLDAGQVAPRAADFAIGQFKKTYGIGLTLHTLTASVTRINLARTPEGNSLVFSFSPRF